MLKWLKCKYLRYKNLAALCLLFCCSSMTMAAEVSSFLKSALTKEALVALQANDLLTAAKEVRKAAEAGDAANAYVLGNLYRTGDWGVEQNFSQALSWYEKAADRGAVAAFSQLAYLYFFGKGGISKDLKKALVYARRGAQLGDPGSRLLVFIILTNGPLSTTDEFGREDREKYQKLARRPISERELDIEARDALYRAAAENYSAAELALFELLLRAPGENNRRRAQALYQQLPSAGSAVILKSMPDIMQFVSQIEKLGSTYTSMKLLYDAQVSATVAGMVQTCGILRPEEVKKTPFAKLIAMSISSPPTHLVFLPSRVPGNESVFLIDGEWEERWTYIGCGKTATIPIKFKADGMGGAIFKIVPPSQ